MPLVSIAPTHVTQECSHCHAKHTHKVASLVLGLAQGSPDFILLPQCTCGAVESLARNLYAPLSNERSHRKAVNALATMLKQAGLVEPIHAEVYAKDSEPRDTMTIEGEVAVEATREQQQ